MNRPDPLAVWRILDANANRALEGLRVLEEYVRFVLDDSLLTQHAKHLRHELSAAIEPLLRSWRARARDTEGDVGVAISTPAEHLRENLPSVAAASIERVKQSLRCLEEYVKTLDGKVATRLESLRYRFYTLEKMIATVATARERLLGVSLYVLIDGGPSEEAFVAYVRRLIDAGVDAIQLREKRLSDRDLIARSRLLKKLLFGTSILLFVNDRPDIAVLSGADGVHVGQDELSVADARAIVGVDRLVGVSTHIIEQGRQAVRDGADYIGVGPVFPSTTKAFEGYAGMNYVRQVAATITLPAFAIGGIEPGNVVQVVEAGLRRVAVGASLGPAADIESTVAHFRAALEAGAE